MLRFRAFGSLIAIGMLITSCFATAEDDDCTPVGGNCYSGRGGSTKGGPAPTCEQLGGMYSSLSCGWRGGSCCLPLPTDCLSVKSARCVYDGSRPDDELAFETEEQIGIFLRGHWVTCSGYSEYQSTPAGLTFSGPDGALAVVPLDVNTTTKCVMPSSRQAAFVSFEKSASSIWTPSWDLSMVAMDPPTTIVALRLYPKAIRLSTGETLAFLPE